MILIAFLLDPCLATICHPFRELLGTAVVCYIIIQIKWKSYAFTANFTNDQKVKLDICHTKELVTVTRKLISIAHFSFPLTSNFHRTVLNADSFAGAPLSKLCNITPHWHYHNSIAKNKLGLLACPSDQHTPHGSKTWADFRSKSPCFTIFITIHRENLSPTRETKKGSVFSSGIFFESFGKLEHRIRTQCPTLPDAPLSMVQCGHHLSTLSANPPAILHRSLCTSIENAPITEHRAGGSRACFQKLPNDIHFGVPGWPTRSPIKGDVSIKSSGRSYSNQPTSTARYDAVMMGWIISCPLSL